MYVGKMWVSMRLCHADVHIIVPNVLYFSLSNQPYFSSVDAALSKSPCCSYDPGHDSESTSNYVDHGNQCVTNGEKDKSPFSIFYAIYCYVYRWCLSNVTRRD